MVLTVAMDEEQAKQLRAKNVRTALILASVALAFLVGMVLKRLT
jgi:hypothetical protein